MKTLSLRQKEQANKTSHLQCRSKTTKIPLALSQRTQYKKGILAHRFVHLHLCRPCAQHRLYYLIFHTAGNTLRLNHNSRNFGSDLHELCALRPPPPRYRLLRLVCPFSLYTAHQPFLPLPYSKTICPGQ